MKASNRELTWLFLALSCGVGLTGLSGCNRHSEKASTQDLAARIESAGDDERLKIVQTLSSRGKAAIPEILQAFQSSDKPETQMILADSVARMPRSEEKKEALKQMQKLAKNENIGRTIQAFLNDPR